MQRSEGNVNLPQHQQRGHITSITPSGGVWTKHIASAGWKLEITHPQIFVHIGQGTDLHRKGLGQGSVFPTWNTFSSSWKGKKEGLRTRPRKIVEAELLQRKKCAKVQQTLPSNLSHLPSWFNVNLSNWPQEPLEPGLRTNYVSNMYSFVCLVFEELSLEVFLYLLPHTVRQSERRFLHSL